MQATCMYIYIYDICISFDIHIHAHIHIQDIYEYMGYTLYICIIILYIYIYIWSRPAPGRPAPGNPSSNAIPPQTPQATTPTGAASHLPPSVKISYAHMLYLHAGLVPPARYITGYLHAVFTTAYNMPIKFLYSSHILANIKISCAIHTLYIHAGHVLPIHYLHDTSITPHPPHRGAWGVGYTFHHSIYNVLLPIKYLYSSHILATLKISCAIHTCWPCTT